MARVAPQPKMAAPGTVERRKHRPEELSRGDYIVTVFDNDYNTVEEVIAILMLATACTQQEAEMETWEVHYLGQSVVHVGDEQECRDVAGIICRIGIRVEVSQE